MRIASPENIRSTDEMYRYMLIDCFGRLHSSINDAMSSNDWHKMNGIEGSIRMLNALIAPYYDKRYKKKVREINTELEKNKGMMLTKDGWMRYYKMLMDWLEEIIARLGYMKILPPTKEEYEFGEIDDEAEKKSAVDK